MKKILAILGSYQKEGENIETYRKDCLQGDGSGSGERIK